MTDPVQATGRQAASPWTNYPMTICHFCLQRNCHCKWKNILFVFKIISNKNFKMKCSNFLRLRLGSDIRKWDQQWASSTPSKEMECFPEKIPTNMKHHSIQLHGSRKLRVNFLSHCSNKKGHIHPTIILLLDNEYHKKETDEHTNC